MTGQLYISWTTQRRNVHELGSALLWAEAGGYEIETQVAQGTHEALETLDSIERAALVEELRAQDRWLSPLLGRTRDIWKFELGRIGSIGKFDPLPAAYLPAGPDVAVDVATNAERLTSRGNGLVPSAPPDLLRVWAWGRRCFGGTFTVSDGEFGRLRVNHPSFQTTPDNTTAGMLATSSPRDRRPRGRSRLGV